MLPILLSFVGLYCIYVCIVCAGPRADVVDRGQLCGFYSLLLTLYGVWEWNSVHRCSMASIFPRGPISPVPNRLLECETDREAWTAHLEFVCQVILLKPT